MKIGFAQHDPRFAFWMLLGQAASARAAELGVTLAIEPASSAAEQSAVIERFVDQRVDALIIGAIDSHELAPTVQRAIAAGIPVVAADTEIWDCEVTATVSSDNLRGAELAAAFIVDQIGADGTVAHLQGPQQVHSGALRSQGFHNILAKHPNVRLAFEAAGDWSYEAGFRLMAEGLAANPGLRAVFAANDPMALGALEAIELAGAKQMIVVGFDALPDTLMAIYRGRMAATVRQQPIEIGRTALEIAWRAAQGQPVEPRVQVDVQLVTADSLLEAALDTLLLFPSILRNLVDSGAALAQERALLRSVIDAIPDTHLFVKDRASRFVITNTAHLQTLGAARLEDIVGKTDLDLFPGELAAQYYADEQAVMDSGQPLRDHIEPVIDKSGAQKWFLTSKVPLRDAKGVVIGHVGMSRDITAIKQAEDERARLQAEVIRMQEATLRELSTPLIPISDNVVVMPLIGSLNDQRTQQILETLLEGIATNGAEIAILDITGVPVVDTQVANALIRAAQAVKLVGAQVVLSGIRPEVAQTMVGLGIDFRDIVTSSTLQNGIAYALRAR